MVASYIDGIYYSKYSREIRTRAFGVLATFSGSLKDQGLSEQELELGLEVPFPEKVLVVQSYKTVKPSLCC